MTTYSTCVFCGRNDSPRTREHVIADWIAREFPDPKWTRITPNTGKRIPFKNSLGLVLKKVCKRCNTGWMRELESSVKPILRPLIHAHRGINLSLANQWLIATWYFKTASAYDVVEQSKRPCFFSPDERRALESSQSLPFECRISLAQYRGTMGHVFMLESYISPDSQNHFPDSHGYAITFVIKHVALQVFIYRRGKDLRGKTLDFVLAPAWQSASFQIWPPVHDVINWPPPRLLDNAGLIAFANRWGGMNLLVS